VIRIGAVAAAQAAVAIVTGPGLLPFPDPLTSTAGKVLSPKETVPENSAAWALAASVIARPAAEMIFKKLRIERLLLLLNSCVTL
jgi:hypothetical protein